MPDPVSWLTQAGAVGVLAFVVWLLITERLVPGSRLRRMEARFDRALALILKQAGVTDRAVDLTARRLSLEEELHEIRQREGEADEPLGPP